MGVIKCFFGLVNILFICTTVNGYLPNNIFPHTNVFDKDLYESVLHEELCNEQTSYITSIDSSLLTEFIDAGIRTPRGILTGNMIDLGNYYQCLGINKQIPNSVVAGKYCMISVPLDQNLDALSLSEFLGWPDFPWSEINSNTTRLTNESIMQLNEYNARKAGAVTLMGVTDHNVRIAENYLMFNLALCIPKTCTTKQAVDRMFLNVTALGLDFEEDYCRLPNDKQWVAGDYVAVVIIGLIGFLTIMSTSYDLFHTFVKAGPDTTSKFYRAFSVYTNTRRFINLKNPVPGTLACVDGLRSFAIMWVIIGHTFVTQMTWHVANPNEIVQWMTSCNALWIINAPYSMDTLLMLSGLLLIYTTTDKFTKVGLKKNLYLFYLSRFLRTLPVLAVTILMQISIFNKVADGPSWHIVENNTHRCRTNWWSTLLHVQNLVNPLSMCLPNAWYLAIHFQYHIVSPLSLVWVIGRKERTAWIFLAITLLSGLTIAAIYNFLMEFPSSHLIPSNMDDQEYYLSRYYVNTIARQPPIYVGMIYGYVLHLYRKKVFVISKIAVTIVWLFAATTIIAIMYSSHPILQKDWNNQIVDSFINTFIRSIWALAVGWTVIACVHGYSGPINWVLSLPMWKVFDRLSYAIYLVHYPLILVLNSTAIAPIYFSVHHSMFKYFGDLSITLMVAFILTILVESPCTIFTKHFIGGSWKTPSSSDADKEETTSTYSDHAIISRL